MRDAAHARAAVSATEQENVLINAQTELVRRESFKQGALAMYRLFRVRMHVNAPSKYPHEARALVEAAISDLHSGGTRLEELIETLWGEGAQLPDLPVLPAGRGRAMGALNRGVRGKLIAMGERRKAKVTR